MLTYLDGANSTQLETWVASNVEVLKRLWGTRCPTQRRHIQPSLYLPALFQCNKALQTCMLRGSLLRGFWISSGELSLWYLRKGCKMLEQKQAKDWNFALLCIVLLGISPAIVNDLARGRNAHIQAAEAWDSCKADSPRPCSRWRSSRLARESLHLCHCLRPYSLWPVSKHRWNCRFQRVTCCGWHLLQGSSCWRGKRAIATAPVTIIHFQFTPIYLQMPELALSCRNSATDLSIVVSVPLLLRTRLDEGRHAGHFRLHLRHMLLRRIPLYASFKCFKWNTHRLQN